MKVSIKQEVFTKALNSASRVTTNKAGLPILSNILLRTDGSRLLVAATNLELASTHYVNAKILAPGEITVPARLISEFVANLPKEMITLNVENKRVTLECKGYSSTINGVDTTDFPELPTIDEKESVQYSLRVDDFKKAVSQTIFASSHDSARPVLTGVFWHSFEKGLYLVGTDGYRLSEHRMIDTESDLSAIVPTTALQEVMRSIVDDIEMVDVLFDEAQVRFRLNDTEITSRLIDGKYPDYRKLIPSNTDTHFTLPTSDVLRTTKIAALFARSSGGSITITADADQNTFSIASIASEVGENSSELQTDITGVSGTITLNSKYIIEALGVLSDDMVEIGFSGKLAPCIIKPKKTTEHFLHIIMPLKS